MWVKPGIARQIASEEGVTVDENQQGRRLRSVRALDQVDLPNPRTETAASILPGSPRVGALDALLREVDDLRLTLETDLTLAAAAVEAGGTAAAVEIIGNDIEALQVFEDGALAHLSELASQAPTAPESRAGTRWQHLARLSAAPFVAAAAVVGLLIGVVPNGAGQPAPETVSVSAQSTFDHLTTLAAQGRTSEVRIAAQTLHSQISALVGSASDNPATAQQALLLLSYERSVIVQSGDSAALHDVLVQSAALAAKIRSALPWAIRTSVPAVPKIVPAAPAPKQQSKPKPEPTTSPTPSPVATKSTPSPKASATPTASASPSPSSSSTSNPGTPFLPSDPDPNPSPASVH